MDANVNDDHFDREEERRQRREERLALRGRGGWIGGVILVLLGLILLGQNLNLFAFQNWWALFLLLPALGSFGTAWRITQVNGGHFGMRARSSTILGLIFTLASGMFLFNLNWKIFGPGLFILAGLGLILNAMLPD